MTTCIETPIPPGEWARPLDERTLPVADTTTAGPRSRPELPRHTAPLSLPRGERVEFGLPGDFGLPEETDDPEC